MNGTIVNAAGITMAAIAQIATVPILTHTWGVDRYGAWLMLTTMPAYLALSDLGFASAATSDMTMQVARGMHSQVRATFQSAWVLVNTVSIAIILATLALAFVLPLVGTLPTWAQEHQISLVVLILYSAVVMNARIVLAGLRATQNYALGTMLYQVMTLLEVTATLTVAWSGGSFAACASAMLCVQILNFLLMLATLQKRVPWLRLGIGQAALPEIRRLWIPALAAMAIPSALAINLQGMVLVTGVFISATAAATFASVRTVSRVAIQMVGAINRATMPELSAAGATGQRAALAKMVALNLATVGFVLIPGAVLFGTIGDRLVSIWTGGRIQPNALFVLLVALATVAHGLWYYTSNLMLASNEHTAVSGLLVSVSIGSVLLAIPVAHFVGLFGMGLVLLLTETACLIGVLKVAVQSKLIDPKDVKSAFTPQFWRS
ncbi:lipopolysaccharide biosynthesis protein [Bradyrhizobium sp. CCBAU 11430]|uniref:lipopolysaccharide biosynthesis protein n=1 Tax=Bradyrhizobium sp. CCBAU 11430 TaxID=1630881 RepID=UPI002304D8C4|nr:hypothetical protein [Bradyrhizobium sp. CCBAU 11430]